MATREIWKYHITLDDPARLELPDGAEVRIEMPVGAEVLCVQTQRGQPTIWAMVNPEEGRTGFHFRVIATGQAFNADRLGRYIGTYQLSNGLLVYHLFEA